MINHKNPSRCINLRDPSQAGYADDMTYDVAGSGLYRPLGWKKLA